MFSEVQEFEKTQLENSDLDVSSIWSIARAHPNGLNQPSALRQKRTSSVGFLAGTALGFLTTFQSRVLSLRKVRQGTKNLAEANQTLDVIQPRFCNDCSPTRWQKGALSPDGWCHKAPL